MALRWAAASFVDTEKSYRKITGYATSAGGGAARGAVSSRAGPPVPVAAAAGPRIALVWRDGAVIRVPPGFAADDLRRVLAVVNGGA